jgi:site-specific DNA recombinase
MAPSQWSYLVDAGLYARLSKKRKTPDNPKGLSENVEIQIAEDQAYAEDKLWSVVLVTSDDDISASKYSTKPRPGYNELVAAVMAGQIEVIICTEMTRLYRRMEELLDLIKLAETTRLRAIWTTDDEGYDLSTPEGIHRAIAAVNNAMLESAKLSRRQKRKKAAQARAGRPSGGGRPTGFEQDGITLRPDEVAYLVEAKDRYLAGETMRDIVRDYFHRGILSPYGKPWQIENFQRVLFNKRYIGVRVHNGTEYPALWPAIFTSNEYDRMVARRDGRRALYPGKGRGISRRYLLTGLLYCGLCGTAMVGSRRRLENGEWQRRYRCRTYDNYGQRNGCGKIFRGADPLEAWITEAVFIRFDSPEVARLLSDTGEDDTEDLVRDYQDAKGRLEQMVADYASGFLTRAEFAVAKGVAEANFEAARQALSAAQTHKLPQFAGSVTALREAWATAGLDWRKSVIELLVEKIILLPGHPGAHRWQEWRFQPDFVRIVWRDARPA